MPRQTGNIVEITDLEITDRANYACYKYNRELGVESKEFYLIWPKGQVNLMEKMYQEELVCRAMGKGIRRGGHKCLTDYHST